jgi:predicted nuclease of predicted toxin-antitoxin system
MRFLVDTNLTPGLSVWLASEGHDAVHTKEIGHEHAKDRAIWQYAKDHGYCILTKDEDFVFLRAADPCGPLVVWVRIGNAVNRVLLQRVALAWPQVMAQLEAGAGVVELR